MTSFRIAILGLLVLASGLFAQPTVSLYDIQFTADPSGDSPYKDMVVVTGGIVTAVNYLGSPTRYFIGDSIGGPWHGIYVWHSAGPQIEIGDSVYFEGKVYEASGETRLKDITGFVPVPHVREIPAYVTTTGALGSGSGEPFEGVLVDLESVRVTAASQTNWEIDDGTGACQVGSGFDYSYEPSVGDSLRSIRGVVVYTSGAYRLEPRGNFDFAFMANQPPIISNVSRTPENPNSLQKVLITAKIVDERGVADARLWYKKSNDEMWQDSVLYDDGVHGDGAAGDDTYGALIPEYQAFTTVQYYISAADSEGLSAYSSADSFRVRSTTLTIYDLQYTGNPMGGESEYKDQIVTVTGIVTGTNYGDQRDGFFISDPGGGPWSGILVYGPSFTPQLGDCVRVSGQVIEYGSDSYPEPLTEFTSGATVTVLGAGTVPDPWPIRADELLDSAEAYEGVLVRIGQSVVTSTASWIQFGEFKISDGTGEGTIVNDFGFEYVPLVGDSFTHIIGCVTFIPAAAFLGHLVAPRFDQDLGIIDKRPPRLLEASSISFLQVNVQFNEALDSASAVNLENYTLWDFTDTTTYLALRTVRLFSNQKTVALEPWDSLKTGYTYTLKVSGIKDTTGNVIDPDSAQSVQFTGFSELAYASIDSFYDFFELFRDKTLTVCGKVTFVQDVTTTGGSRRISAYIQDGSGYGLNLSESGPAGNFPLIQRGNLIEITGLVSEYDGSLQMGGFTSEGAIRLLSEDMPLPEPITFETGNRPIQQSLIRTSSPSVLGSGTWCEVTGTILRVDENIGGGTNIYIDDGSGNLTIRVWDDMNLHAVVLGGVTYAMRDLVGVTCSVAGVSGQYVGDFQMLGGYAEDFSTAQPLGPASAEAMLEIEAKPFAPDMGQRIKISYNAPAGAQVRLRVFNLRGQLVTTLVNKISVGPFTISWDGRNELRELVPLGTYIVHFESENTGKRTTAVKPVVVGTRLK